jgi:hypothetical protein
MLPRVTDPTWTHDTNVTHMCFARSFGVGKSRVESTQSLHGRKSLKFSPPW